MLRLVLLILSYFTGGGCDPNGLSENLDPNGASTLGDICANLDPDG